MIITNISKVYSKIGTHCAFTDIISYQGYYYLGFMQGPQHMPNPDNHGVILRSKNGKDWEMCLQIHCKKDTREPKFMELNGTLFCYFFTIEPSSASSRMITDSWCICSTDGQIWSEPVRFAEEEKYWRPVTYAGVAYCVTHPKDPAPNRPCRLMCSEDGLNWQHLMDVPIDYTQKPNEASLVFDTAGKLYVFIRTDRDKREAYLLTAFPPYQTFEKINLGMQLGGPLVWIDQGKLYLGARFFPSPAYQHTGIFELDDQNKLHLITVLPSMGDSSYMGVTRKLDDTGYFLSYYSSHESLGGNLFSNNCASIYLVDATDVSNA